MNNAKSITIDSHNVTMTVVRSSCGIQFILRPKYWGDTKSVMFLLSSGDVGDFLEGNIVYSDLIGATIRHDHIGDKAVVLMTLDSHLSNEVVQMVMSREEFEGIVSLVE